MNLGQKPLKALRVFFACALFSLFPALVQAADIDAELDSQDGSSGFVVQTNSAIEVARVNSNGNLIVHGNVGVGTWTTQALLDVSTGTESPYLLPTAGNSVYIGNDLEVDGTAYLQEAAIGTLTISSGIATTGGSTFDHLEVTGNSFLGTLSGNVGIGTTAAHALLEILKKGNNPLLMLSSSVNGGGNYVLVNSSGNVGIGTTTPGGLLTAVGGNVGVGTWNPQALFDVSTGGASPLFLSAMAPESVYIQNDLEVDGTAYLTDATIGSLTISSGLSLSGGSTFDSLEVTGGAVFNTLNGNVGIGTTMTGASIGTKFVVMGGNVGVGTTTPGGLLTAVGGNVGVGTWNPQALLDVSTGGASPLLLGSAAGGSAYIENDLEVDGTTYLADAMIGSLTVSSGLSLTGGSTFDHIEVTGESVFNTQNGNVGIGTTMTGASTGTKFAVVGGNVGIGTTTPGGLLTAVGGNVGIGTWNPQALFDVSTGGASPLFLSTMAPESVYVQNDLEVDGTTYLTDATIGSLTISSGLSLSGGSTFDSLEVTGGAVFNTLGGNVGIGTTMTGASIGTRFAVMGGNVGIGTVTPGGLLTAVGGNVGIGTWNPQALLDVSTGGASPLLLGTAAGQSAYIQNDLEVDGTTYLADAMIGALTISSGLSLTGGSTFDTIEVTGESVFNSLGGNVGIGTTMTGASVGTKFAVMGGNVGIGTTTPGGLLTAVGGNVGVGTWNPQALFDVSTGGASPLLLGTAAGQSAYIQNDLEVDGTTYLADAMIGALTISSGLSLTGGSTFDTIEVTGESVFNSLGGNVGIGTTMTGASVGTKFAVMGGNVGIGTVTPGGLLTAVGGNVGVGTWNPQALFDVSTGGASPLLLGTMAPESAYIQNDLEVDGITYLADAMVGSLTVSGGLTLSGSATFSNIEVTGGSVFGTLSGNVGIGTTMTGASAGTELAVIGGNVGIGTVTPGGLLTAVGGNVGIGTWNPQALLDVSTGGASPLLLGAMAPESAYIQNDLEVDGTTYLADAMIGALTISSGLSLTGGSTFDTIEVTGESVFNTINGNVGIGTTMTGASIGTKFAVLGGNVGIGTTTPQGGFVVTNGNVGIGTWAPSGRLQVASPTTTPFLIDVNGNVGIGTTTPGGILTAVGGNVGVGTWNPQALFDVSTGGASPLLLGSAAGGSAYIQNDLEVDGTAYLADAMIGGLTVSAGLTLLGNSTFSNVEVTGEAVFNTQSGNVGIGTTMTGASTGTRFAVMGGNVGIGTVTPGGLLTAVGGNVGVGTWNPQALFDVSTGGASPLLLGAAAGQSAYIQNDLEVDGTTYLADAMIGALTISSGLSLTGGSTFDTIEVTGESVFNTINGNVGIGTTMTGASVGTKFAVLGGNVGIGTTTAAGGLVVMNGNVGIGTWVPDRALQIGITGAWSDTAGLLIKGSNPGIELADTEATPQRWVMDVGVNTANDGKLGIYDVTTGSSVLTALPGGNVGIGLLPASNPGERLEVNGRVLVSGIVAGIVLNSRNGSGVQYQWYNATGNDLRLNNGTDVLTILNSGNVGIGTTIPGGGLSVMTGNVGVGTWNPQALLDVSTGGASPLLLGSAAGGSAYIQNDLEVDGTAYLTDATIGALTITAGLTLTGGSTFDHIEVTGESVFNTLNGNVGIGTTMTGASTGTKLAVIGGNVGIGTTTAAGGLVVMNGNVGIGTWAPAGALIVQGGNVGIGTASPTYRLHVPWLSGDTASTVSFGSANPGNNQNAMEVNSYSGIGVDVTSNSSDAVSAFSLSGPGVVGVSGSNVGILGQSGSGYSGEFITNALNYSSTTLVTMAGPSQTGDLFQAQNNSGIALVKIQVGGNVGIGTTRPSSGLSVGSKGISIGSNYTNGISAPVNGLAVQGNVGIGTTIPGGILTAVGGNVGIGTWNPQALFDVSTGGASPLLLGSAAGESAYIQNDLEVDGTTYLVDAMIGAITISSGMTVAGGSTFDHIEVTGESVFNTTGGNVGIGTTMTGASANTKLAVIGGNVGIGTTSAQGGFVVTNGNVGIGTWAPGGRLQVASPTTTPFLINANGNVGIGTTIPQGALSVMSGNVGIGTWMPQALLDISTGGGNPLFLAGSAPQSVYIQNDLEVDGFTYLTDATIGTLTVTKGQTILGTSTFSSIEVTGESVFNTLEGNVGIGTTMTGASANTKLAVLGGNVGIGTTNAGSNLSVLGNASIGSYATIAAPTGGMIVSGNLGIGTTGPGSTVQVNGNEAIGYSAQTTGPNNGLAVSGNVGIGTTNAGSNLSVLGGAAIGAYAVNPAPTGGMIVSGNVGIGTTGPGSTVQVNGNAAIGYPAQTVAPNNGLAVSGNVGIGTTIPGGILTAVGGNVGIGTWNPQALFDVSTGGASPLLLGSAAGESAYIQNDLEVDGTTYLVDAMIGAITISSGMTVAGGSTFDHIEVTGESVFNTTGGNVGIGTTMTGASANTKLAVIGGNVGIGTTSAQGGFVVTNGNVGIGTWAPAGLLQVNGPANSPVIVTSSGNVGIGTITPSTQLHVYGSSAVATIQNTLIGANFPGTLVLGNANSWNNGAMGEIQFSTIGNNVNAEITGYYGMNNGGYLTFSTANSYTLYERMRIDEYGNIGIGTTTPVGGLAVMNGNVGIGTWVPAGALDIKTGNNVLVENGNVGIGTMLPSSGLSVGSNGISIGANYTNGASAPSNGLVVQGNVGIGTTMPGGILTAVGGNVGVGTWNPQALFDVSTGGESPLLLGAMAKESAYIQNDLEVDGTTYLVDAMIGAITVSAGMTVAGGSTFDHIEVTGESVFNTLGGGNVGIGTTMTGASVGTKFAVLGGNVGIGTTNAGSNLSVLGAASVGAYATNTAPIGGMIVSGNVGIGTTGPGSTVQVNGNAAIGYLAPTVAPNNGLVVSGNVGIGTTLPSSGLSVGSNGISIGLNYTNGTSAPANGLAVQGNVGIGTTILKAALSVMSGNVGIGTWTPQALLDVSTGGSIPSSLGAAASGSAYIENDLEVDGTSYLKDAVVGTLTISTGLTLVGGIQVTGESIFNTVNGNVGIGTTMTGASPGTKVGIIGGNVGIGTTSAGGMLTVVGGNVGVGTWNPQALLDVSTGGASPLLLGAQAGGSAYIQNDLEVDGTAYLIDATIGALTITSGLTLTGGSTFDHIEVTGESVFNTQGGNVGIGTTMTGASTGTKFAVLGGNVGIGTTTAAGALTVMNGNVGIGTWVPAGLLQINGSANSPVVVTSSGNVGIGTTMPGGFLTAVGGNVGIGTWRPQALLDVSTGGAIPSSLGAAAPGSAYIENDLEVDGTAYLKDAAIGVLTVSTGLTLVGSIEVTGESIFNTVNGNVGIGTTMTGASIGTKLAVIGGNVGIGTTTPQGGFVVTNGNVGIGTWTTTGGNLIVNGGGNVGIGSAWPGALLDVFGIIRSASGGFTFPDNTTQTTAATGGNSWSLSGTNIYTTVGSNNVGIGTSTPQGGLVVTNRNVGIGTWAPTGLFQINSPTSSPVIVTSNGNVGIGTMIPGGILTAVGGNVGIGTWNPQALFDVSTGGASPLLLGSAAGESAYIQNDLEVDGTTYLVDAMIGAITISSGMTVAGGSTFDHIEVTGESVFNTMGGNVGIGTTMTGASLGTKFAVLGGNVGIGTTTPQGGFVVTNGNVGMGTWAPAGRFQVASPTTTPFLINVNGNVGIGTMLPSSGLSVGSNGESIGSSYTNGTAAPTNGLAVQGNVGIGTTIAAGGLVVMNGNVGIGTWVPTGIFQVNGSGNSPVIVTSSGNVGIGTTIPEAPLHITNATPTVTSTEILLGQGQSNGETGATIGYNPLGAPSGVLSIQVQQTGGGYGFINLQPGGNVAIGAGLPTSKLGVNGNVSIGGTYVTLPAPTNGMIVQSNVGIGTSTPGGILTAVGGNVGIGTWNPQALLDVSTGGESPLLLGAMAPESAYIQNDLEVDGTTYLVDAMIGAVTVSSGMTVAGGSTFDHIEVTGESVFNTVGGNVGIGTTMTGASLGTKFAVLGGNVGIGTTTPQGGFVVTNGNVGIGTWAPAGLLQVNGLANAPMIVTSNGNVGIGTTTPQGGFVVTNGNVGIGTWAPGGALIVQGGNVGIGTTNPNAYLNVAGTSDARIIVDTYANGGTPNTGIVGRSARGTMSSPSALLSGDRLFSLSGKGYWGSGFSSSAATIQAYAAENFSSTDQGSFITFWTTPIGSTASGITERMRILDSGNVGIGTTIPGGILTAVGGNVGIGTWNPQALLDVSTGGAIPLLLGSAAGGSAYIQNDLEVDGTAYLSDATIGGVTVSSGLTVLGSSTFAHIEVAGESVFNAVGGNVGIGTTMTGASTGTKLAVLGGNVGIGTTTPGGLLTAVGGNVGIGTWKPQALFDVSTGGASPLLLGAMAPESAYIQNDLEVDGTAYLVDAAIGGLTVSSGLTLLGNATFNNIEVTGESVFNTTGGNVGIGTTMTGASANTRLAVLGGNVGIGTVTPGGLLTAVGGNVGVGTWRPQALLDVSTGGAIPSSLGASAPGSVYIENNLEVDGTAYLKDAAVGVLTVSTGLTLVGSIEVTGESIFNTVNGNVGIGTTMTGASAGTKLAVLGGNVGIGTTTPQGGFVVTNGNVGIGTWTTTGGKLIVNGGGNVGIGSAWPGALLDVYGIIRSASGGFTFPDNTTQTTAATAGNAWSFSNGNIYNTVGSDNVGIGTSTPQGGLVVTNGNVGIGTWAPAGLFQINSPTSSPVIVTSNGNVGIGTTTPQGGLVVTNGNVGIGTWAPAGALDIKTGNNVLVESGNVGIGTTFVGGANEAALTVMNGNVGIGTWVPLTGFKLDVQGPIVLGSTANGKMQLLTDYAGTGELPAGGFFGSTGTGGYSFVPSSDLGTAGARVVMGYYRGTGGSWSSAVEVANTTGNSYGNLLLMKSGGNVGIGTTTPGGILTAVGGNVGIGTWNPQALLDVSTGGASPLLLGAMAKESAYVQNDLEVDGTAYLTDATIGGLTVSSGLTLLGSATFNSIEVTGESVFNTLGGNVGIGTTMTGASTGTALAVMKGNVGIGTTTPAGALTVMNGNVGIGTWVPLGALDIKTGNNVLVENGNVGIGTFIADNPLVVSLPLVGANSYFKISSATASTFNTYFGTTASNQYMWATNIRSNGVAWVRDNAAYTAWRMSEVVDSADVFQLAHWDTGNNVTYPVQFFGNGNVGIGTNMPAGSLTGANFVVLNNSNVGIGTSTPQGGLAVMNGNVGIGTWAVAGGSLIVNGGGNVGIGSAWPGALLDVHGFIRSSNSGYIFPDGSVQTVAATGGSAWSIVGTNIYTTVGNDNVGIGTSTPQGGLVVTNGSVGIGTWAPGGRLQIASPITTPFFIDMNGNVGIGTTLTSNAGFSVMNGNVGIGSIYPGQILDVQGTMRASANVGIGSSIVDVNGSPRITVTATAVEVNLQ